MPLPCYDGLLHPDYLHGIQTYSSTVPAVLILPLSWLSPCTHTNTCHAVCATMCSVMGLFGYFAFPTGVDSNIMNSFLQDDTLMQVWRASLAC